jgi:cytochrome o ubiquinol oxidase subunit IV
MSEHGNGAARGVDDAVAGEQGTGEGEHRLGAGVRNYLIGLGLAAALTIASFWVASGTSLIYVPGVPMALAALAIGQMGVHLVFFLHITTGPDNTNNVLALAFGVMIVGIVIAGSLWIMYHLNTNMMLPVEMMDMHLQP